MTSSNWLFALLLKQAVTSSKLFFLVIETAVTSSNWFSWLLKLAATSSNWFFLLLKLAVTSSKLVSSLSLKLAVTSSNWFSLGVVHDKQFYIYVESGFSATSKELPSAFKILHGRPGWQMWNRSSYKGKRRQMSCFKRTSTNSCNTGKATRHQQLWMWTKLVLSPEVNRKHMQQILLLKRVNWSTSQLMLKQLTLLHRFVIYRTTRRRSFG